ncbi:MAG: helix-turn-helix transcriptional regulator [Candidatus Methylacidiphilales bacterium]|nr:AraC family transcriptional regulator [Candidatus Methylacidiphilales bacterium]
MKSLVDPSSHAAFRPYEGGWRRLCGNYSEAGWSVECHDFVSKERVDWASTFRADSMEVCLNTSGTGVVRDRGNESVFASNTLGFYCNSGSAGASGSEALSATREAGRHSFITVELSRGYVATHLEPMADALRPAVKDWMAGRRSSSPATFAGPVGPMSMAQQNLAASLSNPPVAPMAFPIWYQSKALELLAQIVFQPKGEELFCQRQKRVARERVERALAILNANLSEPPDIEQLGSKVGCSPFYLSRTFSREMGMTIPQYLRRMRMDRAAELLLSGKHNVTEAALEVGYSSLSHFSKAFCQELGCCPVLFPSAKALVAQYKERRDRQASDINLIAG